MGFSVAQGLAFVPSLLDEAAEEKDNQKQYQKIIGLFIAGINNFLNLKQPLNPILGETFNGFLGNAQVSLEQISHHPPVSAYFMKSKKNHFLKKISKKISKITPN